VAEGLTEEATPLKNDRDRNTLTLPKFYACIFSGRSIPGKIWMPTNQIRVLLARAHSSRELRTRALQDLGVYKES